jgi:hypothetical protein
VLLHTQQVLLQSQLLVVHHFLKMVTLLMSLVLPIQAQQVLLVLDQLGRPATLDLWEQGRPDRQEQLALWEQDRLAQPVTLDHWEQDQPDRQEQLAR